MKRTKVFIIVFVSILLLFILFFAVWLILQNTYKEPQSVSEQQECIQGGGEWIAMPGLPAPGTELPYTCDFPASDAGKVCTSDEECEGLCSSISVNPSERDSDGYIVGKCTLYQNATDISDCPTHLPKRTQSSTGIVTDYCL